VLFLRAFFFLGTDPFNLSPKRSETMKLGVVKDGKAACKLCEWTKTAADLQKGHEAMVKHLTAEHYRSPLMVSYEDTKAGRIFSGPDWPGDMDIERRRRRRR
jgi:hypothetical protein